MKIKILILLLSFCMIFSACKKTEEKANADSNNKTEQGQNTEQQKPEEKKAILYTNMTAGSESPDIKQDEWSYTGELSPEKLAQGLSELTGLDFKITSKAVKDGIAIDWDKDSTLIANLGDKEQKEEFRFFDADSMRWFMMDSLWLTITNNMDTKDVFYSMNGGSNLEFEELYPVKGFIPNDLSYPGAAFFFAHTNVKGDETEGDGRGDLIDMSDQPFVGMWNSSNKIDQGFGIRYALFDDGTFIYATSELGELDREVFKTGTWSIIDEEKGILELKIEAKWVIPVGDIEKIVPSEEVVVLKEAGLVKMIYKEPEIETHKIVKEGTDEETGKTTIKIDDTVFYDFNESTELFKGFYDLPTN